jgi:predicted acylesterase/phospholipase RssA
MRTSSIKLLFLIAALLAGTLGCTQSVAERPGRKIDDLLAARQADDLAQAKTGQEVVQKLMKRVEAKAAAAPAGTRPTIDFLVISGGGDWGAFGAGVLKGWGKVKGEMARPQFDVVTGVSTGAMIAPFAFIGDDASIERIVHMYRNPQEDWAKSRGMLFFWPSNPSFYALPGLEREMRNAMDRQMVERIAKEDGSGRLLAVNTTNVDFGDMHPWDIIAECKVALAKNDLDHVRRILLASAGIPGVFPAQGIDDYLYVDGAITGNILYGSRAKEDATMAAIWKSKHPNQQMPRIRYWIIFNNQLRFPPQVTQQRWPDIMNRAMIMATQTSTIAAMRHLFAQQEINRIKYGADVQVRVMSVPDDWVPPSPGVFKNDVMNNLADLGEKMGADPGSWRTTPP